VLRRFFFYLIGIGFGIVASMLFFGDRDIDFSYLPNARTVKHLRAQELQFSEKAQCQLNCLGLTESSFERIFKDSDLDVDFGASDVKGQCRTYLIEVEDAKFSNFNVDDCDSLSTILNVEALNCECL
tara:strand:+ start:1312 stop:1692 length:381 start_codon:yes stop_codon:yes gene_type:complete